MSDIRYICLSDTHFGARSSLLTQLNRRGDGLAADNPLLDALVACLREVVGRVHTGQRLPTLVLNGDILELALAETHLALMAFEQFLQKAFPRGKPLFEQIVYVPGNHDHHLWEAAREEQYSRHVAHVPAGEPLDEPWHTTKLLTQPGERPVQQVLSACAGRLGTLGPAATIHAAYPNFGVRAGDRWVVFHHGHYVEPIYSLMSTITRVLFPEAGPVESVYQLEKENFAWIDFLWSALGQSGAAGSGMAYVYESRGDAKKLRKLLRNLAKVLVREYIDTGLPDWAEQGALEWIFSLMADQLAKLERSRSGAVLSKDATAGLKAYVEKLLRRQFEAEGAKPPARLGFVFGHTHKPFARKLEFEGFAGPCPVYNTGGWVVDAPEPAPQRGAAIALLDADLNVVNLKLYSEGCTIASVEQAATTDASKLYEELAKCVADDTPPWSTFAEAAKKELAARMRRCKAQA